MVTNKLQRVDPKPVQADYVRGTEAGHFYLVVAESEDGAIVGFRPLSMNYAPNADMLNDEFPESTRVRVVPATDDVSHEFRLIMEALGFEPHQYAGESQVHFSVVTDAPNRFIGRARALLALIDGDI